MQEETKSPNIKWAQRKDKLFITIEVIEMKNPKIDIVDGRTLKFEGKDKNHNYSFQLELYDEVDKDESKYTLVSRNIFLNIKKKTKGPYWPRLTNEPGKLNWVHPDWNLYIDEDDEDEVAPHLPTGMEQNFPGFGGAEDDLDDEDDIPEPSADTKAQPNLDDLDQEAEKK